MLPAVLPLVLSLVLLLFRSLVLLLFRSLVLLLVRSLVWSLVRSLVRIPPLLPPNTLIINDNQKHDSPETGNRVSAMR